MREIEVTVSELLTMRRAKNVELFSQIIPDSEGDIAELFCQANPGVILRSRLLCSDSIWTSVSPYVNKPISVYDKRITSHNFGDSGDWPLVDSVPSSIFRIEPTTGMKFFITYMQVRFPVNAKLIQENQLYFRVYLNLGAGVVRVINLEYPTMFELVKKANSPVQVQMGSIFSITTSGMVEIEFKYADPYTLQGAPIVLRSSLGEYMEMGLTGESPVLNVNNGVLSDKCWAVVNGKQCVDF